MATKKQKREAGAKRAAERTEAERLLGLAAQQRDRNEREKKAAKAKLDAAAAQRMMSRTVEIAEILEARDRDGTTV